MKRAFREALVRTRYALPGLFGKLLPAPGPVAAARIAARLNTRGLGASVGYFQAAAAVSGSILTANLAVAKALGGIAGQNCLALKAPPLGFDPARIDAIAEAAREAGLAMVFDAHAPKDAQATVDTVLRLQADHPGTGIAIPARWRRSAGDVALLRDTPARLRLVKGEWADPDWPDCDPARAYLGLVGQLAGRAAPVAVASHDPELVENALARLLAAETPCELEQLRGLPRRRTVRIARRLGVPVRVYVPFGPGWWPYAIDKALARPYLPRWWLADLMG